MRTLTHTFTLAALLAAACGGAGDPPAGAKRSALTGDQCNYFDANGTVRICHKTSSTAHPYTVLNISDNACINAHAGHADDYVAVNDPSCQGGGCLPAGAPVDSTLPCCEGLVANDGVCEVAQVGCPCADDPTWQAALAGTLETGGPCLGNPWTPGPCGSVYTAGEVSSWAFSTAGGATLQFAGGSEGGESFCYVRVTNPGDCGGYNFAIHHYLSAAQAAICQADVAAFSASQGGSCWSIQY